MSETLRAIENFKRDRLRDLLSQCTEPEQAFFARMYSSVKTMPKEKIDLAIQQCERTIENNRESE